ncbi:MAG: hydantoinase/oxoprolinase family protein [Desulfovibrio sp.]
MFLGIDVGGTHTDAVVLNATGIVASCKVPTRHDNLLRSINEALEIVLKDVDPAAVKQLNLSTTLSTNAIVENKTEEVGMLVSAGPGIDPHSFMVCRDFHVLDGCIDHRGTETSRMKPREIDEAIENCAEQGVKVYATVSKFSPRNPLHENQVRIALKRQQQDDKPLCDFITVGHELGGRLNFPRRIATAYFNSAVWRLYNNFADAVEATLETHGLTHAKINILKADGGTMPVALSRTMPVQSIFSGPAASVMGIIALCDIHHDSIILDIGGTTTDIAIFASGSPLVEQDGISIGSHPTLVRALKVQSIGIGGDSAISVFAETVRVGPNRLGPSMAVGGERPTLTDCLNYTGACEVGDVEKSRAGIEAFAKEHSIKPQTLAEQAVENAAIAIHKATREMLDDINEKPVYTIHEMLDTGRIIPKKIYLMGGPAKAMKMPMFGQFRLSTEVPENYDVANAIGAALTRTTTDIELFADTQKNIMFIPSLGYKSNIPSSYDLADAETDAMNHLIAHLADLGLPSDGERAQITHASSFNMVEDDRLVGKNIRVKCQIRPGITKRL